MLEAQAAQLTSLAKTEEDLAQIPFILRAQMEEAGIEGIDVELLIPDLTSLDGVAARVQSAIAPISDVGVLSGRALTDQMSIVSGSIASTIVMLEQMRNTAVITPREAAEQFAILSDEINSIDDPGKKFDLMEDVIEDLNMDELAEDIKDTDLLLSLVADRMQGIETPQEVIDLFEAASQTNLFGQSTADPAIIQQAKDMAAARTAEAAATRLATDADNERAAANAILTAEMQAANESLDSELETLSNQSVAYDRLIEAGFSAAEAVEAVGDATIAAAIAGAQAGPELDELYARVSALASLRAETETKFAAGRTRGGGGGGWGRVR
jgi:Cu/Ag efflux protein CusF